MKKVSASIVVEASVEECYRYWNNFQCFPYFMKHVRQVSLTEDPDISYWVVDAGKGKTMRWYAHVDKREPYKQIQWRTIEDPDRNFDMSGAVDFAPIGEDRTRIHLQMAFETASGGLAEVALDIFAHPDLMIEKDLKNFKEMVESRISIPQL